MYHQQFLLFLFIFASSSISAQADLEVRNDSIQIEQNNFALLFHCRRSTDNEIQKNFPDFWTYQKKQAKEKEQFMGELWQRQRAIFASSEERSEATALQKNIELKEIEAQYFEPTYFQDRFNRIYKVPSCLQNGDRFILLAGRIQVLQNAQENQLTMLDEK